MRNNKWKEIFLLLIILLNTLYWIVVFLPIGVTASNWSRWLFLSFAIILAVGTLVYFVIVATSDKQLEDEKTKNLIRDVIEEFLDGKDEK